MVMTPIVAQHHVVVFDVLSDLQNLRVLIEWLEDVDVFERLLAIGGDGHVVGLVFGHGKAQSHQFGLNGVGGCGFRV